MDRALARNLDVKIALARIEQARAERGSTRAELFPLVDVTGGVQRQDNPMPGLRPGIRNNLFEIGFDALWEIDLFGRQQRRLEAASAELEAAGDPYAQSLVTLSAELARSYVEYRNSQALLAITRSNLDSMRLTLAQTERLLQEGIGTRHDVVRAKAQAETTEAQIPTLEAGKTAALRQLEALMGRQPGALAAELDGPGPFLKHQGKPCSLRPPIPSAIRLTSAPPSATWLPPRRCRGRLSRSCFRNFPCRRSWDCEIPIS